MVKHQMWVRVMYRVRMWSCVSGAVDCSLMAVLVGDVKNVWVWNGENEAVSSAVSAASVRGIQLMSRWSRSSRGSG